MIYNARVRRLSTKFQVDTCQTKKDRYAQLRQAMTYNAAKVRRLSTKFQVNRSAHAHLVVEIQAMIYNVERVRRLSTKFQVDTCKTKKR